MGIQGKVFTFLFVPLLTLAVLNCSSGSGGTTDTVPKGKLVLVSSITNEDRNWESTPVTNKHLFSANADGSGMRTLAPDEMLDMWFNFKVSPDRTRIAFTAGYNGTADQPCPANIREYLEWPCTEEILIVDSDGTNPIRVTRNGIHDFSPDWSPDGTQLVFLRGEGTGPFDKPRSVMTINVDGSGERKLANSGLFSCVSWSPNGQYIALISRKAHDPMGTLVVMEADGTNMRELDNSVQNACKGDAPGGKVAWAPSGDKIAFTRTVNGLPNLESNDNAGGLHQIFIAHVDGRELQQITDDGYNYHPKWSPDGKHIVFLRSSVSDLDEYMWRESPDNLFVMKADGSDMQQLTDLESQLPGDRIWHRIWQASWSPDGREIAFTVYRVRDENDELTSSENIYIISADGVDLRKVTDFGYSDLPYLADVEWAIVPDPPMTAENDTLATIEADNRNLAATIEANNAVATATKDNENLLATITAGNQVPTAVSNDPAFTKGEAIGVVRAHLSKLTWTLNQATGPSTFPCTSLSGELVDAEYEHGDRVWTVTSEKGMSWLFYERTGAVVRNSTGGASLVC